MTDPDLHQNIISSVKEGFAEQIEFTKALVRFESTRGAEQDIQDFVFRSLKEEGFALKRFNMDRGAIERHTGGSKYSDEHSEAPIVGHLHRPKSQPARILILQAHVDVVP